MLSTKWLALSTTILKPPAIFSPRAAEHAGGSFATATKLASLHHLASPRIINPDAWLLVEHLAGTLAIGLLITVLHMVLGYAFKETPPELGVRGLRAAVLAAAIGGAAVRRFMPASI